MKKITVIGGGTGTYVVLSGLKESKVDLGVIVSMMDSGGSTGRLRDQLGVLPPGDLRQCLVALSEAPLLWRRLFLYRFEGGDMKGHNFGNIFLSALEKVSSDYNQVIETASFVLKTKGKVIPVTFKKTHLCVKYESGRIIKGEGKIDEDNQEGARIKKAYLEPEADPNPSAIERIYESDYIIIGPGDLYTSIIPVFLVKKVKEALLKTKAKIIYISNLMTKFGQTTKYRASDHLTDLKGYIGREPEVVIINNGKIPADIIKWYLRYYEKPVNNDLNHSNYSGKILVDDLIGKELIEKSQSDKLTRSILRHDSKKLAKTILKIIT